MSSSILEVIRVNHEQSERHEVAIGDELDERPNGQKSKVMQQHRLKHMAEKVVQYNQDLINLHLDADGIFQDELTRMKTNPLDAFYSQLSSTLEYYEKFPGLQSMEQPDLRQLIDEEMEVGHKNVTFSGEEIFGKYLDLNPLFLQYVNVTKSLHTKKDTTNGTAGNGNSYNNNNSVMEEDYLQYLDKFNVFFYIPDSFKQQTSTGRHYYDYLSNLWSYLLGFYKRVHPLIEVDTVIQDWEKEFDEKVQKGEIKLLKNIASNKANGTTGAKEPQPLRLGMFNDPKELEALGLERLKEALEALGLKCGGTLEDRAQRLWSVRGKKLEDIPASLKAKPAKKANSGATSNAGNSEEIAGSDKPLVEKIARLEFLITSLCEVMGDIVSATRRHAEKQQARSAEEKEQEILEEEFGLANNNKANDNKKGGKGDDDDDDDDEGPVYNPLNIPLGWDGKPIPYWLYKLHGLGVEYKCEICGNQSYWGRRAFDRHFQEWRHAHGMRCLGIPNTKHFHDITSIEHVVALYNKIKDQVQHEQYSVDMEEEFEDSHGNVLNRRTYEDLARQGLL